MSNEMHQTLASRFLTALGDVLGPQGLVTDEDVVRFHHTDWMGRTRGRAPLLVKPASTAEVSATVRLCAEHGVRVVPQGGLTGLSGGALPITEGEEILLSLARMNRIVAIDVVDYTMSVEAGVVLGAIQEAAQAHECFFPLSLGAEGSCMIGGNLSTNAGGAQVLRYGNVRTQVLGLEVVLPDGRIWNGLRALRKDNSGYDLKQLFIGAEGTLGIITQAVLQIYPRPRDVVTAWIAVPGPTEALSLLSAARIAASDGVTSLELMHRLGLEGVVRHVPGVRWPLEGSYPWQVLMEWSSLSTAVGGHGMREKMVDCLAEATARGLVFDAAIARTAAEAKAFWKLREGHAEAGRKDGPAVSFDISVPVRDIPAFIERCHDACTSAVPGIRPRPFGHVGDGNLHYTLSAPADVVTRAAFLPMTSRLSEVVQEQVIAFNGSIAAEHGIGIDHVKTLERSRPAVELDLMRAIKRAIDPQGTMNPGKVVRTGVP